VTPLVVQHESLVKLREENQSLRLHIEQQASLFDEREGQAKPQPSDGMRSNSITALPEQQFHELLRLRGEVGNLRVQVAAQAHAAKAQANASRAKPDAQTPEQAEEQAAKAHRVQTQRLAVSYGLDPGLHTKEDQHAFTCISNLREIDGAKQRWALENRRFAAALPSAADIAPYLEGQTMPTCPAGGAYTLNPVNVAPRCSISGHALPKS
jgi:hypothetical protein